MDQTPQPVQTRTRKRRPRPWEKAFLETLGRTGNITAAVTAAGIGRTTAYEHAERNPDFQAEWNAALAAAADYLEAEARRRAVTGVHEPVFYKGELCHHWVNAQGQEVPEGTPGAQRVPLTVKKYSDGLLQTLLKGALPEKYRERASVRHSGDPEHPVAVTVEDNRQFFIALGQALAPYPEAKEAVGRVLEERLARAQQEQEKKA